MKRFLWENLNPDLPIAESNLNVAEIHKNTSEFAGDVLNKYGFKQNLSKFVGQNRTRGYKAFFQPEGKRVHPLSSAIHLATEPIDVQLGNGNLSVFLCQTFIKNKDLWVYNRDYQFIFMYAKPSSDVTDDTRMSDYSLVVGFRESTSVQNLVGVNKPANSYQLEMIQNDLESLDLAYEERRVSQ